MGMHLTHSHPQLVCKVYSIGNEAQDTLWCEPTSTNNEGRLRRPVCSAIVWEPIARKYKTGDWL